jgi:hypothetical protein
MWKASRKTAMKIPTQDVSMMMFPFSDLMVSMMIFPFTNPADSSDVKKPGGGK